MAQHDDGVWEAVWRLARQLAARKGCFDAQRCDDIAQEVTTRAWQHGVDALPRAKRTAWVKRTTRNHMADLLRAGRRRRESPLVDAGAVPVVGYDEAWFDARNTLRRVDAAARTLPPSERAVYGAVVCEGRAIDAVAHEMGVSRAVIDTRLRRMRDRLGAALPGAHGAEVAHGEARAA